MGVVADQNPQIDRQIRAVEAETAQTLAGDEGLSRRACWQQIELSGFFGT